MSENTTGAEQQTYGSYRSVGTFFSRPAYLFVSTPPNTNSPVMAPDGKLALYKSRYHSSRTSRLARCNIECSLTSRTRLFTKVYAKQL